MTAGLALGKETVNGAGAVTVAFLCRVPPGLSAKKSDRHGVGPVDGRFAECQPCRHSAKIFYFFKKKFFAEGPLAGTRQSLNFF